jgi:hypothetical protein
MRTESLSSADAADSKSVPPECCEQTQRLKPKLASILASCDYLGGISRSEFYADILPLLDSVYLGARHFIVVESLDRLIAAKTEPATIGLPSVAAPSTLLSQSTPSEDPVAPRAKGNHLPNGANRLNNPRPVDERSEKPRRRCGSARGFRR